MERCVWNRPKSTVSSTSSEHSVKIGYGISFTRYFYKPKPLRTLDEIRADILALLREIQGLLGEIIRMKV